MRERATKTELGSTQLQALQLMAEMHRELGRYPTQSEIAARIGVSTQQINASLRGLEQRGLVTPVRTVPNELTAEGRKVLRRVERER